MNVMKKYQKQYKKNGVFGNFMNLFFHVFFHLKFGVDSTYNLFYFVVSINFCNLAIQDIFISYIQFLNTSDTYVQLHKISYESSQFRLWESFLKLDSIFGIKVFFYLKYFFSEKFCQDSFHWKILTNKLNEFSIFELVFKLQSLRDFYQKICVTYTHYKLIKKKFVRVRKNNNRSGHPSNKDDQETKKI